MKPIRIDTPRTMLQYNYRLAGYCLRCDRWAEVDLERLVSIGEGDRSIVGRSLRCSICGAEGKAQVRAPGPRRAGY